MILITVATTNLSNKASKHKQGQGNNQALMVLAEALSIAIGGYLASIHFSLPIIVIIILFIFTILLILSTTKGKNIIKILINWINKVLHWKRFRPVQLLKNHATTIT